MRPELHPTTDKDASTIELVENSLKRQHHQIDIYFQAKIDDKLTTFIIEDKTRSGPHSDQLARYRAAIEKDGTPIVPIYLKTGFLYDDDREYVKKHKYAILDAVTLHGFLSQHNPGNDIYLDFVEYLHTDFVIPQRETYPAFLAGDIDRLHRPDV